MGECNSISKWCSDYIPSLTCREYKPSITAQKSKLGKQFLPIGWFVDSSQVVKPQLEFIPVINFCFFVIWNQIGEKIVRLIKNWRKKTIMFCWLYFCIKQKNIIFCVRRTVSSIDMHRQRQRTTIILEEAKLVVII